MKKTYFVTDAHFGACAYKDTLDKEKKLVRWMDSIIDSCEALYFMGDMIDFWYEYRDVVPKGYVRFFGKIAEFTDRKIPVYWFKGNHDMWLFHYVQDQMGVVVLDSPIEKIIGNKKFFLAHGDGIGDNSLGFRLMNWCFHSRFCQVLFSSLHPWFAMRFGNHWSTSRRLSHKNSPNVYDDQENNYLLKFAKEDCKRRGDEAPDFYIFGHLHIYFDMYITHKTRVVIPGDWLKHFSYAEFDGDNLIVRLFEAED